PNCEAASCARTASLVATSAAHRATVRKSSRIRLCTHPPRGWPRIVAGRWTGARRISPAIQREAKSWVWEGRKWAFRHYDASAHPPYSTFGRAGMRRWLVPVLTIDDLRQFWIALVRGRHDLNAVLVEHVQDVPMEL